MAPKTEQAYNTIKREIITGRLTNNSTISVNAIAKRLGMSKTPVRDAFKELESQGFVRIFPNQGIVIQELTVMEATQMYELRIALESYLLKQIVPILTEQHLDRLRELLSLQEAAMKRNDPYEFMQYDNQQHLFLHEIYYNPMIFDVISRLIDRIFYGGVQALSLPGRMEATLHEHTSIVEALEARNLEKTIRALEYHFSRGLSSTTTSLERYLQG
ncbi:MAG: GntR family transcriptional regulator [Synergistales bacterium]|nr:GntR family transcriptional regulator [Synergistales bacterium]